MRPKLAVCFPGTGYTCQKPLLARCAARYAALGYAVLKLDYGDVDFAPIETVEAAVDAVKARVLAQVADVDFSRYGDVVFVAKSLGTAVAPGLAEAISTQPRYLMLTPIPEALHAFTGPERVLAAVLGTQDPHMDAAALTALCKARGIPCLIIDGVGHRLAHADDPMKNEAILRQIEAVCG